MEHCLIYISSATKLLSEQELSALMDQSREKNRDAGITGVLMYFNGSILQVLEGNRQRINRLFDVIRKDSRHTDVIQLYNEPVEKRSFPDWSMGYNTLSGGTLSQLGDLVAGEPASTEQDRDDMVQKIVKTFYQNKHRT